MTTRGSVLSAAARAAAPLLLATLALGACSNDEEPSASTSPSTSPSTTTSDSPSPSATGSTPSSPAATSTPTPPPASGASCPASTATKVDTTGMPDEVAATARKLHAAAVKCDAATLVSMAKASSTGLVGDQAPAAVFTATSTENYVALATLLSLPSAESFDGTIQPRVFSEQFVGSDAEWDKVVDAGLLTDAEAAAMRQAGGYSGHRVGIASDGTWTFFTTGR